MNIRGGPQGSEPTPPAPTRCSGQTTIATQYVVVGQIGGIGCIRLYHFDFEPNSENPHKHWVKQGLVPQLIVLSLQ